MAKSMDRRTRVCRVRILACASRINPIACSSPRVTVVGVRCWIRPTGTCV